MSTWLNRSEIAEAVHVFQNDPVLGPAARYLRAYQELIDANSDGWSTWGAGTRPAGTLCEIVGAAMTNRYRSCDPEYVKPTMADVKKAVRRIKSFVTKNKYLKADGITAPEFVA